eukprot:gene5627-5866_t
MSPATNGCGDRAICCDASTTPIIASSNDRENDVSQRQDDKQHPRLVLMVPLRRCGSHALRLRLNASSAFHSPYPLHIVDFMPLLPLYGDLDNDRNYFQLVVDVVGLQAASIVKWNDSCNPIELFQTTKSARPRSIHRLVGEMLLQSAINAGATVAMDKSLDSIYYAEEMMDIYPDMLFINVVRDPRAQVSSINRAIIHEYDTSLNTLLWDRAQQAAQSLTSKFPDRVLTMRFEDFIADQEAELRKICSFMGIAYQDDMVDIQQNKEAAKISGMSALWENNKFNPIPANVTKFQKMLPEGDIEMIEKLLADHMMHLGYQPMTIPCQQAELEAAAAAAPAARQALVENERSMAAALQRSRVGRVAAWDALKEESPQDYILRTFRADYLACVEARLRSQQNSN